MEGHEVTNPVGWRAAVAGTVTRLTVAHDTVFAGSGAWLQAFDAVSGRQLWHCETGTPGPFVVAAGVVYATGGGHVRALDVRTGRERWRFKGAIPVRPAVAGGRVCVLGDSPRWGRTLHVLSARSGAAKWRMEADLKLSAPAMDGDLVYAGCADGVLLALRTRNGRESWRIEPEQWHPSWPERGGAIELLGAAEGVLYLAGLAYLPPPLGFVAALDARTGNRLWETVAGFDPGDGRPDAGDPPLVMLPDGLCVGERGRLTQLTGRTGRARVYPFTEGLRCSPPVLLGGLLCAGTGEQMIEAFEAETGRRTWALKDFQRPPAGPPPVAVSRGRLLVGGHKRIYQVDPVTGTEL
jgi:outer membrane protein assembly factor BamB